MKQTHPGTQRIVLSGLEDGHSVKQITKEVSISVAAISRLRSKYLQGLVRQPPGRRPILLDADKILMKRQLLGASCRTTAGGPTYTNSADGQDRFLLDSPKSSQETWIQNWM